MGEVAEARRTTAVRVWRCAVILASLGLVALITVVVLRAWWPAVYLRLLPSPAAVIAEVHAVASAQSSAPDDVRSGPVAALEDRFPRAAVEAALLAALARRAPDEELADLAREWVERDPACTGAVLAAVLAHRAAAAAADRARTRAAYLTITGASLEKWLRKRQEADDCWPAATAPPGPGRWLPGRAASTAFIMLMFMEAQCDHRTPGRAKKTMQRALAALLAQQRPDGRCADDARDHAAITLALVELYARTSDTALLPTAQRALDAARQDLSAAGDLPWERDTALALLLLDAHRVAADAGLDVGHALDDPCGALRACLAADNAVPTAPTRCRWREDGQALALGDQDGAAATLAGFRMASSCLGHRGPAPEAEALSALVVAASADPHQWTPMGLEAALRSLTGLPVALGTPRRIWLEAATAGLASAVTIGEPDWDATWGSAAQPRDAAANALLGTGLLEASQCLSDRRFWEHEAIHPLR